MENAFFKMERLQGFICFLLRIYRVLYGNKLMYYKFILVIDLFCSINLVLLQFAV